MPLNDMLREILKTSSVNNLAEYMGVSKSTIYRWLSGKTKPTPTHMHYLKRLLHSGMRLSLLFLVFDKSGEIIYTRPPVAPETKLYMAGYNMFDIWRGTDDQLIRLINTVLSGLPVYAEGQFDIDISHIVSQGWYLPTSHPRRIQYKEDYFDIVTHLF